MSGKNKSKLNNQSSKSTSSSPYREFPAATSTFSGLVIALFLGLIGVTNTYASSISISLTGNVSLNLIKNNNEAVFGKSTTQTATVTSDHFTGYTLTIAGSNDTGRLVGANDDTKYLSSITTPLTESQFDTDDHNDQWGFLPGTLYNTNSSTKVTNTNYQPSPTATNPTTIDVTNSPNTGGTDYTLALGARVSSNMSLDSYGQTFVLAATGNGYDYHIGYSDDMTSIPSDQYAVGAASNIVQLSSVTPTKDGFVFQGWCSQATTVDVMNGTTCPSGATVYQPGATITLDGTTSNNLDLHAIWTKGYETFADAFVGAGKTDSDKTSGYFRMQDMTSAICDSIVIGSPAAIGDIAKNTLIDTRNNKTYLVAKYADGHCWMRENLNLPLTAGTSVDSYNFSTGEVIPYIPAYTTQTTTDTTWANDGSDGARSYGGDKDKYIGGTDITTAGVVSTSGQPYEKIGIYYNWTAAIAQNGTDAAAATTEVFTSICPKGWRMPAYSGNYSFSELMGAYSLPTTNQQQGYSGELQNPLNFNRLGRFGGSPAHVVDFGRAGYYWSSWGYSSTAAYHIDFYSEGFKPQNRGNMKGQGFSVRCVAV